MDYSRYGLKKVMSWWEFVELSKCIGFPSWCWHTWEFVNHEGYFEVGLRVFGLEHKTYYKRKRKDVYDEW